VDAEVQCLASGAEMVQRRCRRCRVQSAAGCRVQSGAEVVQVQRWWCRYVLRSVSGCRGSVFSVQGSAVQSCRDGEVQTEV